jgi:hypothetical protein
VQHGARITAIIVYLYIRQILSKKHTAQALAELFGIPLSSGTKAEAGPQRAAPCTMRSSDSAHSGRHSQGRLNAAARRGVVEAWQLRAVMTAPG